MHNAAVEFSHPNATYRDNHKGHYSPFDVDVWLLFNYSLEKNNLSTTMTMQTVIAERWERKHEG